MKRWTHTLNVRDVFHDDSLSLAQKRDEIVRRINRASFFDGDDCELVEAVGRIAESTDTAEFDEGWDSFYDWADWHGVWVATV